MAYILDLDVATRMSLEEYVAFVDENVDLRDFDSLVEAAGR
jgi:hypothetical protein